MKEPIVLPAQVHTVTVEAWPNKPSELYSLGWWLGVGIAAGLICTIAISGLVIIGVHWLAADLGVHLYQAFAVLLCVAALAFVLHWLAHAANDAADQISNVDGAGHGGEE